MINKNWRKLKYTNPTVFDGSREMEINKMCLYAGCVKSNRTQEGEIIPKGSGTFHMSRL